MIEQISRPFVSPSPLATRRVAGINITGVTEQVIVAWGAAGTLPTPTLDDPTVGFKVENCDDSYNEKSRKTHQQTITDPNSGASVTFDIIDNIVFSKAPADSNNVGVFRTETTSFSVPDPFAGTDFGDVPKSDSCSASYTLANSDNAS